MSHSIVLITGANSGVGLATTKVLVSASTKYHVVIAARSLAKAETARSEVEAEISNSAGRLTILQLDVTDVQSIAQAYTLIKSQFGRLDALINNAAVGNSDPDVYTRYKACMDTNVVGPAVVAEIFRPLLFKSSNPYSIFVSSGAGSFGRAIERHAGQRLKPPEPKNGGAYHVSKAALNMLALREHHQYAEQGLKVFAISPGFVVSNLRGTSEELRTGWGKASPASESGVFVMSILDGHRDADVGKLIRQDGVDEW